MLAMRIEATRADLAGSTFTDVCLTEYPSKM
jgi:hypothetical protein